jgi:hypothetical protein
MPRSKDFEVIRFERQLEEVNDILERAKKRGYFTRYEAEFLELFFTPIVPSSITKKLIAKRHSLFKKAQKLGKTLPIK